MILKITKICVPIINVPEQNNYKHKDPKIEAFLNKVINGSTTSDTNQTSETDQRPTLIDELNCMPFDDEKSQPPATKVQKSESEKDVAREDKKEMEDKGKYIVKDNNTDPNKDSNIDDNKEDNKTEEDQDMDVEQNISPQELKERLYCRQNNLMKVYELDLGADIGLTDFALLKYIDLLRVPEFRGIFMLDELPERINPVECGFVNMSTNEKLDPHWICYAKIFNNTRICFDSLGGKTPLPLKLQKYMKTPQEFRNCTPVIEKNYVAVQRKEARRITGHLCLFVLTSLMRENFSFQQVIDQLKYGFSEDYW